MFGSRQFAASIIGIVKHSGAGVLTETISAITLGVELSHI